MFHEVQRRTVLLCISPKAVELHSERGDVQEGIFGWALANLSDFGAILGTREAVGGVPDHFAIIFEDPKSAQNLLHHKGRPLRGVDCSEYEVLGPFSCPCPELPRIPRRLHELLVLVHCRGKNKVFPSVLAAAMVEEMRKSGLRVVLMDEHTTRLDLEKHWSECKMEIDVEVTPVFLSKGIVRARRNQEPGSGVPVPLRTFCLFCAQLCEVYAFQQPSDSHYMGQLSRYRDEIIVNLEELSPTEEEQEGWATAGVKPRKSKVKGVKSQEAASQPLPPPSSEKDKQEELDVLERELEQLRLKKKRLELAKRVREARKEVEELEGELK